MGNHVTFIGTNRSGATGVRFNGTTATTFNVRIATTAMATVSPGTITGNVTITTPGGTSNGLVFTLTYPDLVVGTTTAIPAGTYNPITVTCTGNVTVNPAVVVQTGGTLTDGYFVLSGAGSFTLAAGAKLGICDPADITASRATGAVQLTGTPLFSTNASYM